MDQSNLLEKDVDIYVQEVHKIGVIKCGKLSADKNKNLLKENKEWSKDSDFKCLLYNLSKGLKQLKKINDT